MTAKDTAAFPTPKTEGLKVLISGVGAAGPVTAFWLARFGCKVTIIERSPHLRATGQQVDLRGQGIAIMKLMGLEKVFRAAVCPEPGTRFVDRHGATKGYWGINTSSKGSQTMTTEWEIMRGDLVRILYDATKDLDGVKYVFNRYVKNFTQDEGSPSGKVHVTFSDDSQDQYDILIGADGVGSATRKTMLGPSFPDSSYDTGVHASLFTAPAQEGDTNDWNICLIPGGKVLMTRKDSPDNIRVYFLNRGGCGALDQAKTLPEQKAALAEIFADTNDWHTQRFLRALDDPMSDDLYCQHQRQIRLPEGTWGRGRVVLVGDSAYCTTLGGVGVTGALIGGYVLAGEIYKQWEASKRTPGSFSVEHAAREYERRMRPLIADHQVGFSWMYRLLTPKNRLEIWIIHAIIGLITLFQVDKLLFNVLRDEEPVELLYPDYFGAAVMK